LARNVPAPLREPRLLPRSDRRAVALRAARGLGDRDACRRAGRQRRRNEQGLEGPGPRQRGDRSWSWGTRQRSAPTSLRWGIP
jgi:hypothetical protein